MWKTYLVETVTGRITHEIEATNPRWSITLNAADAGSVRLRKSSLQGIDKRFLQDWTASIVICYVHPNGTQIPWCGGPVTSRPTESRETIQFNWSGMRKVMEKRVLSVDKLLTNTTFGQMAWELISYSMEKPAGKLPLRHATPNETGINAIRFQGWDLRNNSIDNLLTKLTNLDRGPDIMFRPKWKPGSESHFIWDVVHGTKNNPYIAQKKMPDFDTTSEMSDISNVDITNDATQLADRIWCTGSGQGWKTARDYEEDLSWTKTGRPFLERVITETNESDPAKLALKARGALNASRSSVDQLTLTVRADSLKNPMGTWFVGDQAYVTLDGGWMHIPAGTRPMRIIKAHGDFSEEIIIELQENSW